MAEPARDRHAGRETPAANHPPAFSVLLSGGSVLGFDTVFDHQVMALRRRAPAPSSPSPSPDAEWPVLVSAHRSRHRRAVPEPLDLRARAARRDRLSSSSRRSRSGRRTRSSIGRPRSRRPASRAGCALLALTRAEQMLLFALLFLPFDLHRSHRPAHDRDPVARGGWCRHGAPARAVGALQQHALRRDGDALDELRRGDAHRQLSVDVRRVDCSVRSTRPVAGRHSEVATICRGHSQTRGGRGLHARQLCSGSTRRRSRAKARTFGLYAPMQQSDKDSHRGIEGARATPLWLIRTGFVAFWLLLPSAVAGPSSPVGGRSLRGR